MTEAPRMTMPASGPALRAFQAPRQPLTNRKEEEFRDLFKRGRRPDETTIQTPIEEPPTALPALRRNREMTVSDEPSGGLAPEEQPSVGAARLDPAEWLATINPGGSPELVAQQAATALTHTPASHADVSLLVERWVKRVALGGDQRRGVARLDIGQGRFAGAELLVVAEAGRVSVELSLPPHEAAPGLRERLLERLERRGVSAEVVVR
jgi:hypothetical protein